MGNEHGTGILSPSERVYVGLAGFASVDFAEHDIFGLILEGATES